MYLRQLALAARTLEPVRSQLFDLFGIPADYNDPGVAEFGLHNSVMTFGDSFLEVVAPTTANTAVDRSLARAGSDIAGYMALLQVEDFSAFQRHADALGLRQVWHTQRDAVSACHIHPKDIGGAIVSFDEMRPPASWLWAGPGWQNRQAADAGNIRGCVIRSPQPRELCDRWAAVTGMPADDLTLRLQLDTFVSFVAGEREAVAEFVIDSPKPAVVYARAERLGLLHEGHIRLGDLTLSLTSVA